MKRLGTLIVCLATTLRLIAAADMGTDSITAEWMREWYQWGDLRHYLDNYCDVTTYQVETTGGWATPEPLLFSINGNSYRWNKYYLNGFRVDSRIQAGDALYEPDMFTHSMQIDYNRGSVYWQTDSMRRAQVSLSGQAGNIGSYAYSAKWLQELQEGNSAIKRLKDDTPLQWRKHTAGAASADVVYNIHAHNNTFTQHIRADFGRHKQLRYDHDGIAGTYDADYYRLQLDGQLPAGPNKMFDNMHYILRAGYRGDGLSEFGYNENEVAQQAYASLSVYGHKNAGRQGQLTTGLTYAMQHNRHRQTDFMRNILDVDGEGFDPWYPDGHTHELNWAVDYRYTIQPWLHVHLDSYNSLLTFAPLQQTWTNHVYLQGYHMPALPLYDYHWQSEAFTSGMLENSISIEADYAVLPWLRLRGSVGATLDGILLSRRSVITPSWEAKADIHIEPAKWFKMDLIAANYRIPYTYETVQFLSNKYLNAEVNYAGTGTLLTTTGGRYHRINKGLLQPQYVAMDIPIVFTIGRHEIQILSSIKKYYNTWAVRLAEESADGYTSAPVDGRTYSVYAMQPGERYYEVTQAPKTGTGFWDSPVFASNVIKYTYNGKKVFFSMSWQSYCLSGASALGNGVQTEDIQVLSESTASPNAVLNDANMGQTNTGIRSLGRLNQDRAYIARLQLGVNITDNWQLSLSGKFRDGTPIAHYCTQVVTDGANHSQAVVWAATTRGINVVDGNFGERTDSFFNFDLRLKYRGAIRDVPFAVQAVCYNIWDFATELNEYAMYYDGATGKGVSHSRYPLSLCIPRGLLLTLSVGLEKNK